jgi:AcrR family transcriptional regulator
VVSAGSDGARRQRLLPADRRIQVIEAATRLIGERGFWGVSVHDIAAACGITDAGLLHHFGTKDALLIAVLAQRDQVDDESLAARLGIAPPDLYEAVRELPLADVCAAVVARNARQPEIVRLYSVLNAESLTPAHPAHDYFITREARVIAFFGSARSQLHPDPAVRGRQVIAMMDGIQLRWLRDLDRLDLVAEWDALFGAATSASAQTSAARTAVSAAISTGPTRQQPPT